MKISIFVFIILYLIKTPLFSKDFSVFSAFKQSPYTNPWVPNSKVLYIDNLGPVFINERININLLHIQKEKKMNNFFGNAFNISIDFQFCFLNESPTRPNCSTRDFNAKSFINKSHLQVDYSFAKFYWKNLMLGVFGFIGGSIFFKPISDMKNNFTAPFKRILLDTGLGVSFEYRKYLVNDLFFLAQYILEAHLMQYFLKDYALQNHTFSSNIKLSLQRAFTFNG